MEKDIRKGSQTDAMKKPTYTPEFKLIRSGKRTSIWVSMPDGFDQFVVEVDSSEITDEFCSAVISSYVAGAKTQMLLYAGVAFVGEPILKAT